MDITVNGEILGLESPMSVQELIERLGLDAGPVAVERNREVVPRAQHAAVMLEPNDVLEIVHFVGGG